MKLVGRAPRVRDTVRLAVTITLRSITDTFRAVWELNVTNLMEVISNVRFPIGVTSARLGRGLGETCTLVESNGSMRGGGSLVSGRTAGAARRGSRSGVGSTAKGSGRTS